MMKVTAIKCECGKTLLKPTNNREYVNVKDINDFNPKDWQGPRGKTYNGAAQLECTTCKENTKWYTQLQDD